MLSAEKRGGTYLGSGAARDWWRGERVVVTSGARGRLGRDREVVGGRGSSPGGGGGGLYRQVSHTQH